MDLDQPEDKIKVYVRKELVKNRNLNFLYEYKGTFLYGSINNTFYYAKYKDIKYVRKMTPLELQLRGFDLNKYE